MDGRRTREAHWQLVAEIGAERAVQQAAQQPKYLTDGRGAAVPPTEALGRPLLAHHKLLHSGAQAR